MLISRALMIGGLLAIGLCLPPAKFTRAQQQPGTVSVRPRSIANQPGIPEVKATVDRSRVPLGEEVTFTLSPAHVVTDSRYKVTLFFGDRARQVMSQPKTVHVYTRPATYTYSVLVEPASQQPKPTPAQTVAIPNVKLTAAPTSVETTRPVSFAAELSHPYPNIRYRFVFGDGSGSDWQTQAKAAHAYRSPGTYQAYVDLGVSANGSIKQASGSKRESIQVSEPAPLANVALKLSASATSTKVNAPVTFAARVSSQQPGARYRFDFGDQTAPTAWQTSQQVRHRYNFAGKFSARAEVRVISRAGAQSASSNSVAIEVGDSTARATIDLKVIPESVPVGVPAFFRAIPSAADSKTRYRFNFGDGSPPTEWSASTDLTHAYAASGAYSVFVEIGAAGDQPITALGASAQRRVRITPVGPADNTNGNPNSNTRGNTNSNTPNNSNANGNTNANGNSNSSLSGNTNGNSTGASPTASASGTPTPTPAAGPTEPTDWWKYLIIIALILFAAYQVSSYVFAPRPKFVPHLDPGDADVGGSLAIDLQMEIDPNIAGGEVRLDTEGGSLIKSERTE